MTTRDEHWTRDPAADDADLRVQVSFYCRASAHRTCDSATCGCDCHEEARERVQREEEL